MRQLKLALSRRGWRLIGSVSHELVLIGQLVVLDLVERANRNFIWVVMGEQLLDLQERV